jgi:GTP-binding protein
LARALRQRGVAEPLAISAASGEGVMPLLRRAAGLLAELPPPAPQAAIAPAEHTAREPDRSFQVAREPDGAWRVTGAYIEKIVKMTRWEYYDAVMRFQRILEALDITEALRRQGVQPGDTVRIGDKELEWSD